MWSSEGDSLIRQPSRGRSLAGWLAAFGRSMKVRGIEKLGGRVELRSHVEEIIVEEGRAVGVKLRSGNIVRARKAVVSNASIWDTIRYNGGHVLYNGHDKV